MDSNGNKNELNQNQQTCLNVTHRKIKNKEEKK